MAMARVNPTRMELKKLQARYTTARRGHKLLKDKRDELMRQFLEVVRENKALRERVEERLAGVYQAFSVANAVMSPKMLEAAMICPAKEGSLEVIYRNRMSVTVPEYHLELQDNGRIAQNTTGYGLAFTSGELDDSLQALSDCMEDLIRLAQMEKTAQLLAKEIEKTRRRVNALEYIMIPQYLATMKSIKMKLEENERGNITRLMKVKDMMLQEQRQVHRREDEEAEWEEESEDADGSVRAKERDASLSEPDGPCRRD